MNGRWRSIEAPRILALLPAEEPDEPAEPDLPGDPGLPGDPDEGPRE